jgi:hypothetical protein
MAIMTGNVATPRCCVFFRGPTNSATFHEKAAQKVVDHRRRLRANCAECQALCCVSLAFDRSEWFGFDKAADVPCPLLRHENTCAIFSQLTAQGHAGCANFDCYGAGQRVSELFGGRSWRDDPEQARRMFAAFRRLKDVHELQLLLHEAALLDLPEAQASRLRQLLVVLEPEPLTLDALGALDLRARNAEVHALLRELRPFAAHRRLPLLR